MYDLVCIGVLTYIVSSIVYLYRRKGNTDKEKLSTLTNEKEEELNKLRVELTILKVVNEELKDTIDEKSELQKTLQDMNDNLRLNLENIKREYKYLEIECKKLVSLNKDKEDYIEELERKLKETRDELIDLKEELNISEDEEQYEILDKIRKVLDLLSKEYTIEYLKRESSSICISIVSLKYKELSTKDRYSVSYLLTIYSRYIKYPEYNCLLCFMDEEGYLKNGKSMSREDVFKEIHNLYEDNMIIRVLNSIFS